MDWLSLLRRKIRSGYLISFLLLLFSFCLIFYVQQRLLREYDRVVHSYVVLNNAETLKTEVTAAETGMRGYLITKDSQYLAPYKTALKSVPALCDEIKALTADNAAQHEKTEQIEKLVKNRMDILSKGLATFQSNGFVVTDELKKRLDTGLITMDSAKSQISDFRKMEEKIMQERKERLSGFFSWAKWMAIISLIIVFFALLYSMVTFNREFKKRVNADKTADQYRVDLESNKTELHEKNLELKKLRDLERFTSTGRIARTIAHEVRNPLTNILLATEQLKETESGNEDSPVLLDLINRNAARINQLVSDLLNATRFSQLDFELTNINELIEEMLEFAKDRVDLNQITVEKKYSPELCVVSVDKEKMKVALLNIVVNAIEAMEKGEGVLQIITQKQGEKCVIEIRDNGKGMDDDVLQKSFEPYFTSKPKGNGLGLTITQNIILNHNGSIRVHSKPGQGTAFVITLEPPNEATTENVS